MKIKPKQLPIIIPTVVPFDDTDDALMFLDKLNQMIHGRSKLKYENLGKLNDKQMILLYMTRNSEFQLVRNEFKELIEAEEVDS